MRRSTASVLVIASLTVAAAANAQSFNCRGVHHADEQVICKDPYLSKLDEQLSGAFAKVFDKLPPRAQKELADDEDDWVASRHQCGADSRCIAEEYRNRIRELTGLAPPPGQPTPPVAAVPSRREAEQALRGAPGPVPPRQAGPETAHERPQPPGISERQPAASVPRPPFPVVEAPPPQRPDRPSFPVVERPAPPPPVVEQPPPAKVVEQPPSPPTEQRTRPQPERKSQTTVTVREQPTPERSAQPSTEVHEQPNADRHQQKTTEPTADRRQQANVETRAQSVERKQPAAGGSGTTNAGKENRPERKSASQHEAGRTNSENPPPSSSERTTETDVVKAKPRSQLKAKHDHGAAAATTAAESAAPAPPPAAPKPPRTASTTPPPASAGSAAKPSIQWVDPPPAR